MHIEIEAISYACIAALATIFPPINETSLTENQYPISPHDLLLSIDLYCIESGQYLAVLLRIVVWIYIEAMDGTIDTVLFRGLESSPVTCRGHHVSQSSTNVPLLVHERQFCNVACLRRIHFQPSDQKRGQETEHLLPAQQSMASHPIVATPTQDLPREKSR